MRYAIFADRNKEPIRKDHIMKNILKEHKEFFSKIIQIAQQKFRAIFGYNFVEVPPKSTTTSTISLKIL